MEDKEKLHKKKISIKNIGIDKLLLLALAGVAIVIVSIPFSNNSGAKKDTNPSNTNKMIQVPNVDNNTYESVLEKRLEEILVKIEGVGKVDVMITIKDTGEMIVDSEKPYSKSETIESDREGGSRNISDIQQSDTTIYSVDESGNNIPFVIKELAPQIQGVAIIIEGGGNAVIVKKVTDVAEALLNVSLNRISVMKMKN